MQGVSETSCLLPAPATTACQFTTWAKYNQRFHGGIDSTKLKIKNLPMKNFTTLLLSCLFVLVAAVQTQALPTHVHNADEKALQESMDMVSFEKFELSQNICSNIHNTCLQRFSVH